MGRSKSQLDCVIKIKKGILHSNHLLKSVANLAKMFAMYARHHVDHDSQIWSLDGTLKCFVEMYMEYTASLLRYRYGTLKELNGCFLLKLTSNKNM